MEFGDRELEKMILLLLKSNEDETHRRDRSYYIVIFKDQRLSDYFRQYDGAPFMDASSESSVEKQFMQELQTLVDRYIRETTQPFPLKWFIDLTEQRSP